eukprot:13631288-Ditylum_brightwellii.AAC.1
MVDLDLKVKDGLLAVQCYYPTNKDIEELPRVWLTKNEVPWDPSVLDKDESITIPSCWDGESEFMLASNVEKDSPDEINRFGDHYLQNQHAMLFFLKAASFLNLTSVIFNSFNNIKKK